MPESDYNGVQLEDYPSLIEEAQLDLDGLWQDHFQAQEGERIRELELNSIPAEGSNAEARKNWRDEQFYSDERLQRLKQNRIHTKTVVNEAQFKLERLQNEFRVLRLLFAAKHGIKEI